MNAGRVIIAGVGALGCFFAARLSAAGIAVAMLGNWPDAIQALRRDGVRLVHADGSSTTHPVEVSADPLALGTAALALVLVKAWQTEAAAAKLRHCLAPDGLAVSLQNGLGNYEKLVSVLGATRTAVGVTTIGARIDSPGVVRAAGEGVVSLESRLALDPAANLLSEAGLPVTRSANLPSLQWGKLVINAAINPLTALLDVPNGEVAQRPAARALLRELAMETAGVAYAAGIPLPYPDPAQAVEKVAEMTASNISSMLQDVRRGAPTEVDAINGAVVTTAAAMGIAAPLNWSMWQMVLAMLDVRKAKMEELQ